MKILYLISCILLVGVAFSQVNKTDETKPKIGCPLYGIDFYLSEIFVVHLSSWEDCGHLCGVYDGCFYWTYDSKDSLCYLKNASNELVIDNDCISGDKHCP